MNTQSLKLFAVSFAIAGLVGCGSGAEYPDAADGTITKEQAATLKTNIQKKAAPNDPLEGGTLAGSMGLEIPGMDFTGYTGKTKSEDSECATLDPATPVDADLDDLPANLKITLACDNVAEEQSRISASGFYNIRDNNDSASDPLAKYAGFSANTDFSLTISFDGSKNEVAATTKGEMDLTRNGTAYNYIGKLVQSLDGSMDGQSVDFSVGANFAHEWRGTNAANPQDAGTAKLGGFYKFLTGGENTSDTVTLKISSENLTYDSTCPGYYKNGSFTAEDGDGNRLVWTYANCGIATTYNGDAI